AISHPHGEPKTISFGADVLAISGARVTYRWDPSPGSSGAPMLAPDGTVVAMHHAAHPARDREDSPMTATGATWTEASPSPPRLVGEGILLRAIQAHLGEHVAWRTTPWAAAIETWLATTPAY